MAFTPMSAAAIEPTPAAVVCSAGVGSIAAAMGSGRPFIAVPDGVDQPDNAYRCRRLGLCSVLPRPRYERRRVAGLLADGLADRGFPARSAKVVEQLAAEDGVQEACDAIDGYAARLGGVNARPGPPRLIQAAELCSVPTRFSEGIRSRPLSTSSARCRPRRRAAQYHHPEPRRASTTERKHHHVRLPQRPARHGLPARHR